MWLLSLVLCLFVPQDHYQFNPPAQPQPKTVAKPKLEAPQETAEVAETSEDSFRRIVIERGRKLVRERKMNRRQLLRLRVALLSPAFRAEAMAVSTIQLNASGATSDVQTTNIDWAALGDFLERMIPIILQLIEIFGGSGVSSHSPTVEFQVAYIAHWSLERRST